MVRGSLCLIVNPVAGGGRSLRALPAVTAELTASGQSYQVAESRSLEHATRLAAQAAAAGQVVVAVGGDGMAGALAGAAAAAHGTFGIIPAGRGNDLARVLRIPADPAAAARVLAAGHTRKADLIGVRVPGRPEQAVAGSVYAGIPSVAGELANRSRWLPGPVSYPAAALRALAGWRPARFRLELAGDEGLDYAGYAVVIANSAYFGAGMMVAPPARIDDGVLDIVTMRDGPKLAFLRVLLTIRGGTHVRLAQVGLSRAASVTLTMDRDLPAAADGEALAGASPLPAGTPLAIRALPGALTALVPPA